jgi:Fe-S-cluster-containing dehydrogenase component
MALSEKKIRSLFNVNYNKSASSCNPCMDACKKVNNKINGRKLSIVSNNEMKKTYKSISLFLISSFARMCLLSIPLSSIVGTFILEVAIGK